VVCRRWFGSNIGHGEENGEDDEAATVDEGRRADAQDARAGESENECDRAQAEADPGSDVSASNETRCDAGGRSKEEKGVMAGLGSFRRGFIKLLTLQKLFRTDCFERVIVKPQDGPGAAAARLHPSF